MMAMVGCEACVKLPSCWAARVRAYQPCVSFESVASSNLKETNKPRQEPAGNSNTSRTGTSGPMSLVEVL